MDAVLVFLGMTNLKKFYKLLLLLVSALLLMPLIITLTNNVPTAASVDPASSTTAISAQTATLEMPIDNTMGNENQDGFFPSPTSFPTPTPSPTPDPFSELYGCEMVIQFDSGPLKPRTVEFTVLGKDYFVDKGDKFAPGQGTGIFYEAQRYFILHSSYFNGNILKPMEAEFIRRYLENWGSSDEEFVHSQINELIGSNVLWICDGKAVFKTRITSGTRLSHVASDRLWLEPENLEQILIDQEGLTSEWIGKIEPTSDPVIYLGFCGWGSNSLASDRFVYFRYLIQLSIIS